MAKQQNMILIPRDGMLFKDGRSWSGVAVGRKQVLSWPHPPTLRGVLRSLYGRRCEQVEGITLTPDAWLARTEAVTLQGTIALCRRVGEPWQTKQRMWHLPADAWIPEPQAAASSVPAVFLDPLPPDSEILTLSRDSEFHDPMERLWRPRFPESKQDGRLSGQAKPGDGAAWWTEAQFLAWLQRKDVQAPLQDKAQDVSPRRRYQIHVAIANDTLTAKEGALFGHDIVETLVKDGWEWGLALQAAFPDDSNHAADHFTGRNALLGGNGKLAGVENLEMDLFAPPDGFAEAPGSTLDTRKRRKGLNPRKLKKQRKKEAQAETGSPGLRLIAVTPASFSHGWLPDGFRFKDGCFRSQLPGLEGQEIILRAAYMGPPLHMSGWDRAKLRPRAIRRLVPAGSVFFFVKADGTPFTSKEILGLWMCALGSGTDEGLGRFVPGLWSPTPSSEPANQGAAAC